MRCEKEIRRVPVICRRKGGEFWSCVSVVQREETPRRVVVQLEGTKDFRAKQLVIPIADLLRRRSPGYWRDRY